MTANLDLSENDENQRKITKLYDVISVSATSLKQVRDVIESEELASSEVKSCLDRMSQLEACIRHVTCSPPIAYKLSYVGRKYRHFSGIVFEVSLFFMQN